MKYAQPTPNVSKSRKKMAAALVGFIEKHWIIKFGVQLLSAVWMPLIVKHGGVYLHLLNPDETLTILCICLTAFIYAYFALILFSVAYRAKVPDSLALQLTYKESIIDAYSELCRGKYSKLCSGIQLVPNDAGNKELLEGILDPKAQLEKIITQVREVFHNVSGIPKDNIAISIAYKLPFEKSEWEYIQNGDTDGGLPLTILTTDQRTVFYRALHCIGDCVYEIDKLAAETRNAYIPDDRDIANQKVGSIVCRDICVTYKDAETSMEITADMVLSVASYGVKFASTTDQESLRIVESNLKTIISKFASEIRIEYATLIYQLMHSK